MTKEQEEAIEDLKSLSPSESSIDKVLFLIKEQQEENKKKDKIIDLMAKEMFYENNRNVEKQHFQKIEEIIKYFKRRIK